MRIRALAVMNEQGTPCSPCGACRQVILEFGRDSTVLFREGDGFQEICAADPSQRDFIYDECRY